VILGRRPGCGWLASARVIARATVAASVMATALAAGLAGCATTGQAPASAGDSLSGRLSVRVDGQPDRALNAGFELTGSAAQGQLLLSGPLGTTLARASWSPGQAVLRSAGDETAYADLDALALATLGEVIPMAALFDWLRGRAWAGAPAAARADAVPGFAQLGWQIDLTRWSDGWVEARRAAPPAVTVRARLEPAA
jgi:outer membrane lipoprotein LolB